MVVALAIAVLVTASVTALLAVAVRGLERATDAARTGRVRAILMERWVEEIQSAYSIAGRDDLVFRIEPDPDREDFSRIAWSSIRSSSTDRFPEIRRLAYETDRVDGRRGLCLLRMDRPAGADRPNEKIPWSVVLEDVAEFRVEATADGRKWTAQWGRETGRGLPRAVRLRVKAPALGPDPLEILVAVPSEAGAAGTGPAS